jgi:hypothetical protein
MSYILDALKRAEQQRGAPTRGAASLPRAIATDFEPRPRWWWIVGGLAGVGVCAGVIAFWPSWEATVATPQAPVATPATTVIAPASSPAPAPPPTPALASAPPAVEVAAPPIPPRAAPAPPRVASAPPPARVAGPRPAAVASRAAPPAPTARSAGGEATAAEDLRPAARVASSSAPSPPTRVQPRVAPPPADVALAVPPGVPSPEPPAAAPAGDLKALAAKLSIQVLSWAPERKDRFVFLAGRKYGEGQMVDDKILIEQITEDGVVLSYQGERLTLKGR